MINKRLVRFDIRLHKDDYVPEFWDEPHRHQFLLRSDVEWPLSVDPLVWPSVFYSEIFREVTKLPFGTIEVDPHRDGGDYWLNLNQMRSHYEQHKQGNARGVPIALHLHSELSLREDIIPYTIDGGIQCGMILGHTQPSESPVGSELLGFDVADASWISGLNNCGYTAEDKQQLQPTWSGRLNEFGLLKTYEAAVEFRGVCDRRVSEHAPFWVFSIWRLPG